MTDKQILFCKEYMIDLNAAKAARRAGYSEDSARSIGYELLTNDEISNYIQEETTKRLSRTNVTIERIEAEIARLAFSDIRDYYREDGTLKNPHELSDDAAAALSGIEVVEMHDSDGNKIGDTTKIKPYDKLNALDKLARRLGMFEKDNDQHVPKEGRRMEVVIVRPKPVDD